MLENFNAIIPLLSVLFGGIITYSVTVKTKINEISLIAKIDARDNVWIPLCTTLEDVFEYIDKNTLEPGDMISFSENIDSKKITNELFNYLKAKNRVFLCCKTRILLIHCQNLISEYENLERQPLFRQIHSEQKYIF